MNLNDDLPVWQQPESRRLEFKEIFPSGNQIAKTVIAFAADRTTVFKTVQVPDKMRTSTVQDTYKLKVLDFCREQRSIQEMMTYMNLKHRANFLINYIHPLLQDQLISLTIPDKPKSPRQKYIITDKGQDELNNLATHTNTTMQRGS